MTSGPRRCSQRSPGSTRAAGSMTVGPRVAPSAARRLLGHCVPSAERVLHSPGSSRGARSRSRSAPLQGSFGNVLRRRPLVSARAKGYYPGRRLSPGVPPPIRTSSDLFRLDREGTPLARKNQQTSFSEAELQHRDASVSGVGQRNEHLHRPSPSTQSRSDSEMSSPQMGAPGRTSMSENNGYSWVTGGLPATECRTNPSAKDGPTDDALAPYPHSAHM